MQRWLAIYVDRFGKPRAAILEGVEPGAFPFGVDEFALGLADFDGEPVTLVQLPDDPDFRPLVADVDSDAELEMQFVDLPAVAPIEDD